MIIDFRSIGHDFYGKVEQPVLTLKTPDGRIISTVSNYYGLKPTFRFNDVSEVEFSVPAFFEGENNNGYDDVIGTRLVEVEPFGDFVLVNPVIDNEGGRKEVKTCKAYSLEYRFNYKKAEIPAGTYNFYNPVDNEDTIIQMIVEKMPDWSIGEIDRELIGRWRTFENVDDNLYSFMMNTLQESYNCLFLFDTFNKKINVMEANRSTYNLPIYLSYNNLVKSVNITELSDEIVTALSGYGSGDEVNIRSVNPNGTNTIYNLDYFISNGDLPTELADKWTAYDDSLDLYRQVFSNLNVLYLQKVNERNLAKAKLSVLQTDYDAIKTTYLTAQTTQGQNPDYDEEINNLMTQLTDKQAEIDAQNAHIEMLDGDVETINKQISDVVSACKITSYFTEDEVKVLSQYFIQDSIADDTFVIPEYSSSILQSASNVIDEDAEGIVKIIGAEVYASNIAQIFTTDEDGVYQAYTTDEENGEQVYNAADLSIFHDIELPKDIAETVADQLNDEAKRKVYEFRGGNFEFKYNTFEDIEGVSTTVKNTLKGDVVNVDLHYNVDNLLTWEDDSSPDTTKAKFFMLTATLRNAEYRGISYPNMNLSLQGMILTDMPQVGDEFVSFKIQSAVIYTTASNTEYQKQAIVQELYDYTYDSLQKLAFPSYEFSVESGNFIFAQEFEAFKDRLELGSTINLALDDNEDNIIQPILIEVSLNYDDESDFAITFSNKYRSSSSEFQLADLITDINRTTRSTTLNKADYKAYKDSKAGSQVETLTTSALDVTRNKVINSINQSIEWDSTGMFFRKMLPNGSFDPKQIGIINEDIAFTKDNWKTVDIAIGAFEDANLGEGYGIIAPSIFGTLLAGENLVIENKVEGDAGDIVKQFKVDATGAWLHNSSLAFTQEPDPDTGYTGGKILIDPRYGIAAGNIELFTLDGTDVVPTFWDTEENKIIWDESEVVETADGSVYYVPLNSQFYFDITTGNAYFSGTISGKNIIAQTINGEAIKQGSLSGSAITDGTIDAAAKLFGDISENQLYVNILTAINKYATIAEEGDKISLDLIGGLTNMNFEGGTITADSVDAENITGNLIEAINASIGTIDADKITVSSSIQAGKLIIDGENGKLAIDPDYGIAAGNGSLFTVGEDGSISPSFVDENGDLVIDSTTGAPTNSSFFFDINTGQAYFTGPLNASQITTGKLSSDYLDVKEAFITDAMISNLSAGKIQGGQITADVMQANVISAINSYIGSATINGAKINAAEIDGAKITDLDADNITSGTIDASLISVTNLDASNILANTITSEFSNSIVGQIGDAAIKSAMIENLSFDKITGFDINTTNLTIHSDDGKSTWSDNTISISDGTRVRVQIGEDAESDYNMYIWDTSGNLMFDALGLTEKGIQREIIKNDMVSETANISAGKLDIDSLFKEINDSTNTIKSSKIYLDDKNQTLDVEFNTLSTTVSEQGETINSQGTSINTIQGQISSKVWQQDIEDITDPLGNSVTNLSTQYTTLSQDLSSFKTEVGSTYSTKEELNNTNETLTTLSSSVTILGTDLDGITGRVESTESSITELDGDVDNLTTRMSAAELKITDEAIINTVSSTYSTKEQTITDAEVLYVSHTSATTAPSADAAWSASAPAWVDGQYMWQKIKYTYGDNTTDYSDPTCITGATGATGAAGNDGDDGINIVSISEEYYLSSSNTSATGGSWQATMPEWETGKYIWIRSKITWSEPNPTSVTYTDPVLAKAINHASENASNAMTKATQTAEGFSWIVSGDSESNFTLTDDALTAIAEDINLAGKITFSDFKTSEDGSTGFVDRDGVTVITGNHILTGSLSVGLNLEDYVTSNDGTITNINNNLYGSFKVDENGNPVYKFDENGDPIPARDNAGNIIYDEDGNTTYERVYETDGVFTSIETLNKGYNSLENNLRESLTSITSQLTNIYTKDEIDEYLDLVLSNTTGSLGLYGSLFKYITADPLKGLVIQGFDVDTDSYEETIVYEYVYSAELGQYIYQPVPQRDSSGNILYDEQGNIKYQTKQEPTLTPSPYSVNINNTSFIILNEDTPVTTISGNTMNIDNAIIDNAEVTNEFRIGDYVYREIVNANGEATLNLLYQPAS